MTGVGLRRWVRRIMNQVGDGALASVVVVRSMMNWPRWEFDKEDERKVRV